MIAFETRRLRGGCPFNGVGNGVDVWPMKAYLDKPPWTTPPTWRSLYMRKLWL